VSDPQSERPEATPPVKPAATPAEPPRRPVWKRRAKKKERDQDLTKPDEFVKVGGTIADWILDRRNVIGIAIGVLLLALGVWGGVTQSRGKARAAASEALFEARRALPDTGGIGASAADDLDPAARKARVEEARKKLDAVIAEHGSTPQATQARLDAGSALFRVGDYEGALPYFEAATGANGVSGLLSWNGKAYALESLGRYDEAIVAFEKVREMGSGETKEQGLLDLARVHESKGDFAKARELYAAFETEFPDSLLLPDAQARAAALAGK
jgi:tetratricopeptide (TPR) repeat protein